MHCTFIRNDIIDLESISNCSKQISLQERTSRVLTQFSTTTVALISKGPHNLLASFPGLRQRRLQFARNNVTKKYDCLYTSTHAFMSTWLG